MSESDQKIRREQARIDKAVAQGTPDDKQQLDEARRAVQGLREAGVEAPKYTVISPYERKRLRAARNTQPS
jgi:hypothetical protein